jgi:uncharacterized membrane protein YdjX (TVP38/TMEM64 family)
VKRKGRILLIAAILAALAALFYLVPAGRWLLDLVAWVRGAGTRGVLLYFVIYVLAAVVLFPESILTMGAGFLYGPFWGTALISPASVIGATLAFLAGRFLARDWVARKVAGNPKFEAIDSSIGYRGLYIVFLLRLSPLFPFNLLNYALGLTRVRLKEFVIASFIGMLPGTFLYAYLGSSVTTAAQLLSGKAPHGGHWGQVLFFGGLAATAIVTALIAHNARKALSRAFETEAREGSSKMGATPL